MKKSKIFSFVLTLVILFSSFNSFTYAENIDKIIDLEVRESANLIEFKYKQLENGEMYFYEEILTNNHIHTKKYKNDTLVDEFDSFINVDKLGRMSVKIINAKSGSTQIIEVTQDVDVASDLINPKAVVPPNRTSHPRDNEYYLSHSHNGHMGIDTLTYAAVYAALGRLFTGGHPGGGAIAAATKIIIDGGFRNVWYTTETYHPYGMDMKGRPLWKKIKKLYSGNDRTNLIETMYYDSDLVVEN